MTTETMRSIDVNGVSLKYTDTDAGDPAIVFVHGWTCDHTHWRKQVPEFSKSHRVLALDQRGHGQSDKPDEDYTIDGFVSDLAAFISATGLERPVVVGHSMGGVIALNLARKHPGLVRGIVMIDAPATPLPDALRPLLDQVIAGLESPDYMAVAEGFVRINMFNPNTPAALADEILCSVGAPQRVAVSALQSILEPASIESGAIPVPALFIRAETAWASEDDLRARYPGLEVTTLPCAHFVQWEKPEDTNRLVGSFVEKVA